MTTQPEALDFDKLNAMHERGTINRGHIDKMLAELRRLHAEVEEQCRLNAMGQKREARLMAENEVLDRRGREAPWLARKLDTKEAIRIEQELLDAMKDEDY